MNHEAFSSLQITRRESEPTTPRDAVCTALLVMEDEGIRERTDWIVIEEPLEIRAQGPGQKPTSVAVTMRTPGHDAELAVGFLYTEGLVLSRADVVAARDCVSRRGGGACNVVQVVLSTSFDGSVLKRNFFATSSCGVCGKATLDQIAVRCPPVEPGPAVGRSIVVGLPNAMREAQTVFDRTGGLHAAGLFDTAGHLIAVREDVGRHNASRSCKRPPWRASRSSARSRLPRAWQYRWPIGWGLPWSVFSGARASMSIPTRDGSIRTLD
jgi:FdhD protein